MVEISNELINLPLENMLREQLYKALHGDIIEAIIKEGKVGKFENYWRYILEGHSFKVEHSITGKFHQIFMDVKEKLRCDFPIDFYISSSPEINAFAISSFEEGEPSILNINSGLLHLMTDEELGFVIGHEIGHLISKNADLMKLINFVFPESQTIPKLMQNKIKLWSQLSELTADRYGFIACPDLKTCISAFFKMSSGLDAARIEIDFDAFIAENEKRIEFFKNDNGLNVASHPINPVRIKAIELFSKSKLYSQFVIGMAERDNDLFLKIEELTSVLLKLRNSELDYHVSYFIATAGLITSSLDEQVNEKEIETIKSCLSDFIIFPDSFLERIIKNGDVEEVFMKSLESILEINPGEKSNMMNFLISMIISDRTISKIEVDFLFDIGTNVFKYSKKEVAQYFGEFIQNKFMPNFSLM